MERPELLVKLSVLFQADAWRLKILWELGDSPPVREEVKVVRTNGFFLL